jgi:hypothetical protein
MGKALVILSLIFSALVIISIASYFLYEKPIQDSMKNYQLCNMTIKFVGNYSNAIKYNVSVDFVNYFSGETTANILNLISIPINSTYIIYTIGDDYYNSYAKGDTFFCNDVIYKEVPLTLLGNASIYSIGNLKEDINLKLIINDNFKCPQICFRVSKHLVYAKINYTSSNVPKRLINEVDKCYILNNLSNGESILSLSYLTFGELNTEDFIKVYLIDNNYDTYGSCTEENEDKYAEDVIYVIK